MNKGRISIIILLTIISMKTSLLSKKIAATVSSVIMLLAPMASVTAESNAANSLRGIVNQQSTGNITINSITLVKNTGMADGTFENGWKWVIDISAPWSEQNLMMKFENWMIEGVAGGYIIPVANNMRFYSSQSSNANSQGNAIWITAPNTYSSTMFLNGNLDNSNQTRRVQITVETRIPQGTHNGSYSTNFGIRTQ